MSDNPKPTHEGEPSSEVNPPSSSEQEQTFTQADVDRVVRERVQRERAKYADYDDLKAKASTAKTAEERLAEIETRYQASEARALRSDIAAAHGISTEDRDLFLTGTDEETLTAQAKRLAARESERKRNGNVVPTEGNNSRPAENEERAAVRGIFGQAP